MGSSSKKKKQKKADFQKVKLKVGKRIPKGNIVDTTFKAKKIIIKAQLQNAGEQQDGRIKRDIKEYLSKLKHNSMTARGEAMKNLKESLLAFPELIQTNLHALIECLLTVVTDPYTPLRKLNVTVLKLVFSNIQPVQVVPFFPLIVAHLRCGMTHLIHEVQSDSLSVIDLLIDFFPQHLKYFSKHLLQDFLNQISNQSKTFSASAPSQRKNSDKRVLAADPSRKVTSLAWYLQVLHRLQNVLKTVLGCADANPQLDKEDGTKCNWDSAKPFISFCSSKYVVTNNSMNSGNPSDFFEDREQLSSLLSSLMPLLFQIWIEAKNLTSGESLEVYQCIAEIIHILWKIIGKWQIAEKDLTLESWFIRQFGKTFISNCMTSFPYSGHFKPDENFTSGEASISQNTLRLNLLLCDVLTCVTSVNRKSDNEHLDIVKQYVVDVLNACRKRSLSPANAELIVDIMKKLFLEHNCESNQNLLVPTVLAFQTFACGSPCYMHFLQLLRDIVEQPRFGHLSKCSILSSWLVQIPIDLVQPGAVPWKLIDIMRLVAPRRLTDFLSILQARLPIALECLAKNFSISDGSCSEARRIIVDMIYWVPQIETSLLSCFGRLCTTDKLELPLICHGLQVLSYRYQKGDLASWSDGRLAYPSFLLSISLGSSKAELMKLQSRPHESHLMFTSTFCCDADRELGFILDSKASLVHQNSLMKVGLKSLHSICTDSHLCQLLHGFLIQILADHSILPLKCVQSLLELSCNTWMDADMPMDLRSPCLQLSMLFLEFLVNNEEIHTFSLPVLDSIMSQPNLSNLICHRLFKLASGNLSDKAIGVLGEMTLMIVKSGKQQHTELLENVLQELKNANEKIVSTSLWFVTALYEISCKHGRRIIN